jgi:DAACS family dicarboxylate/amino acid:cation (Na+ or H+) symporter
VSAAEGEGPSDSGAASPLPRHSPLVRRILIAMFAGAVLGQAARMTAGLDAASLLQVAPWAPSPELVARILSAPARAAEPLGVLGSVVVNVIKGLAGPLLFVAVIDAFLRTRVRARGAMLMVGISLTNAVIAVVIGLTLSNLIQPGRFLDPPASEVADPPAGLAAGMRPIDFLRDLIGFVPTNPVQPFLESSILSIVILAVLGGAALRRAKDEQIREGRDDYRVVERAVATAYRALEIALGWVIATIPLAVFGVVARTVAQSGFRPFVGLGAYVGVAVLGLMIQVVLVYQAWIFFVARMPLRRFWSGAREAVVYAMGASSSLATLPVTLRCLDRMGVRRGAARLAACVGTNLNNDGILLYEAMAVLFVAQVYRIDLGIGQQLLAALSCVVAGIGIAGIPEAGLISLALVLSTVGLPVGILPLLLTVDWVLSRCRAMTNVVSDIAVAVLLDRAGVGKEEDQETTGAGDL